MSSGGITTRICETHGRRGGEWGDEVGGGLCALHMKGQSDSSCDVLAIESLQRWEDVEDVRSVGGVGTQGIAAVTVP